MWGHYWDTEREECLPHTKTETFLLASFVNAAMINIKHKKKRFRRDEWPLSLSDDVVG